ncbi:MAG: bis-aminopropyl spermidine synthase family protein [Oligoflexales bacterium]
METYMSTKSVQTNVPSWDELIDFSKSDQAFYKQVEQLKQHRPEFRFKFGQFILKNFFNNAYSKKFLNFSWNEIIELLADQVIRNQKIEMEPSTSNPHLNPLNQICERRSTFGQLPCTAKTARARVQKISEYADIDSPILILGDDDMVSLRLLEEGYKKVTVVDIDEGILKAISSAYPDAPKSLFKCDLRNPPPQDLLNQGFEFVLMDPYYSIDGIKMFLEYALALTKDSEQTHYLLNVHLLSLKKQGLKGLSELLFSRRLQIMEFYQGFNIYPVPDNIKTMIGITNRFLMSSKVLATNGYSFPYFLSDAILLNKNQSSDTSS